VEIMGISHDSTTPFLQREHYDGKDLYDKYASLVNMKGATLIVDYSQYLAFIGYFGWTNIAEQSMASNL
jgi:hypothetical protein